MPLDGLRPAFNLDVLSLEGLAHILRHRELWPNNWKWASHSVTNNWGRPECGTAGCAWGIALQRWGGSERHFAALMTSDIIGDRLGIDHKAAAAIFTDGAGDPRISAEDVAGRIDDYLAGREIRYCPTRA